MECLIERHKHDWSSAQIRCDLDYYLVDDCFIDEKFIERCREQVHGEIEDEILHPTEKRKADDLLSDETRELLRLRGYIIAASSETRLRELRSDESPLSVLEAIGQIRLFDVSPEHNWGIKDAEEEIQNSICSNSIRNENRESSMWSMYIWTYHNAIDENFADTVGVWSTGESIACIADFPQKKPRKIPKAKRALAAESKNRSNEVLITPEAKRLDLFLARLEKFCKAEGSDDELALAEIESFIDSTKMLSLKQAELQNPPGKDEVQHEPVAKAPGPDVPISSEAGESLIGHPTETVVCQKLPAKPQDENLEPFRDRQERKENLAVRSAIEFCRAFKTSAAEELEVPQSRLTKEVCQMLDHYHGLAPDESELFLDKFATQDGFNQVKARSLDSSALDRMQKRLAGKPAKSISAIPAKPGSQYSGSRAISAEYREDLPADPQKVKAGAPKAASG